METGTVTILPVIYVDRGEANIRPLHLPATVTDINAYRYQRERLIVERREMRSLLEEPAE